MFNLRFSKFKVQSEGIFPTKFWFSGIKEFVFKGFPSFMVKLILRNTKAHQSCLSSSFSFISVKKNLFWLVTVCSFM